MKLASFEADGAKLLGVSAADSEIVDVTDIVGSDMIKLIRQADHMLPQLANAASNKQLARYSTDSIRWLPPVPRPGKICCVAVDHPESSERGIDGIEYPAFFLKPPSSLVGHGEAIVVRRRYGSVHSEPAMAIVIASKARDVEVGDALQCVFGYTVFNNVTGDATNRHSGADTFGCMGPWLVTADDVADPDDLDVHWSVSGNMIAELCTRDTRFKAAELVSFISQFHTLEPGDVISFGPASTASIVRDANRQTDLQRVDGPVEIRIAGLGTLINPVAVEDRDIGNWRL